MSKTHDFIDLNDILQAEPETIYLGGISSALISKEYQLVGDSPTLGWVRLIMNSTPLPSTKVLLLTNSRTTDVPTVVYWQTLPGRSGRADFEQALKDADAQRCPSS